MGLCIRDNGTRFDQLERVGVFRYGRMEVFMRDNGKMIWPMEKVD